MNDTTIGGATRLGFPWATPDPFLFCAHHDDAYPAGNEAMGPSASLAGRDIGQDFAGKDGWRMYHGDVVPGFPQHPHRGFETVTLVRRGYVDHSDSLGATARFGEGDVQWLTAGGGIVHSEMFPLIDREGPNTTELFQIWLNLPAEDKLVAPNFSMFWSEEIPRRVFHDAKGRSTEVTLIAGALEGMNALTPPPSSWAARPDTGVTIWTISLAPDAEWTLPAGAAGEARRLYYFRGDALRLGERGLPGRVSVDLVPDRAVKLTNGPEPSELLLLGGRPIAQPVAQHGPFVMNDRAQLQQAFVDYQRTGFGGWPWPSDGPVHPRDAGRFAQRPGGTIERPPTAR